MKNLKKYFDPKVWEYIRNDMEHTTEIRIRVHCPLILIKTNGECIISKYIFQPHDIDMLFNRLTEFSAYAYENEINQGYLTIPGGHRIGMLGEAIIKNQKYVGMKNIRYLNFRICHNIDGFGIDIVHKIIEGQTIKNTLIVSKPGMGKTTLLRNLVKHLSNHQVGTSITVIDERNEISGAYLGIPQTDLGMQTDVLCGMDKENGILMAIRSMSPKIIALDEIGATQDVFAILKALNSGVQIIATIHGNTLKQVKERLGEDILKRFEVIIFIEERGKIHVV